MLSKASEHPGRIAPSGAMRWILCAMLLFTAMAMMSCECAADRQSERDTYDAIGPEYEQLVEESPRFNEEQKQRRRALVAIWRADVYADE